LFSLLCSFAAVSGTLVCQANPASANPAGQQGSTASAGAEALNDNSLVIKNDSALPDTYPHSRYSLPFITQGGGSVLHWRLARGILPPGLKLEDNGVLHGEPTRAGEYRFAISVTDNGRQRAVQKEFVLRVIEALTLIWKAPAHVNGNRIEGSVEVSNTTVDDVDLTFVVYAIAENGRATAIGYQHLPLPHATVGMELPFGESLPFGAYIVHVDVVGEVASKNRIYRQPLQTAHRLRVTVGP
jgi:putative Ig domain-containing protein